SACPQLDGSRHRAGAQQHRRAARADRRGFALAATITVGRSMRSAAWDAWVAKARSVRIEDECARRGVKFNGQSGKSKHSGPCPKCGGDDRFAVNTSKQVFNCRGCGACGDTIALVQFLDDADFTRACETLTGEPPPKMNGKDTNAGITKIVAAEYPYHDANGALAFVVERIEFRKADASFVMKD